MDGRAREEQQLLDLAPDALGGQVVERQAAAHRPACAASISSSKRAAQLDAAQHAQAVVAERCGVDHPQPAPLEQVRRVRRTGRCSRRSADPRRWR